MANDLEHTQEDPVARRKVLEDDLGKERLRVSEINQETTEMRVNPRGQRDRWRRALNWRAHEVNPSEKVIQKNSDLEAKITDTKPHRPNRTRQKPFSVPHLRCGREDCEFDCKRCLDAPAAPSSSQTPMEKTPGDAVAEDRKRCNLPKAKQAKKNDATLLAEASTSERCTLDSW